MHPRPQYLATDLKAAQFTAPELFRIVKAGVKYSAMPSWPADRRDDEIWHLVAFLRALPTMSPADVPAAGARRAGRSRAMPAPFGPPTAGRRYALRNDDEPPVDELQLPHAGLRLLRLRAGRRSGRDLRAVPRRRRGGRRRVPQPDDPARDYLARTLAAYAAGRRRSGYMQMVASELSPAQIARARRSLCGAAAPGERTGGGAVPALGRADRAARVPSAGLAPARRATASPAPPPRPIRCSRGSRRWYLANQMRVFRGRRARHDRRRPARATRWSRSRASWTTGRSTRSPPIMPRSRRRRCRASPRSSRQVMRRGGRRRRPGQSRQPRSRRAARRSRSASRRPPGSFTRSSAQEGIDELERPAVVAALVRRGGGRRHLAVGHRPGGADAQAAVFALVAGDRLARLQRRVRRRHPRADAAVHRKHDRRRAAARGRAELGQSRPDAAAVGAGLRGQPGRHAGGRGADPARRSGDARRCWRR